MKLGLLEDHYTRFLNRTGADWLALVCALLLIQAKIPAIVDRFYTYEPIILVIYVVPSLIIGFGLLRSRNDFVAVLRGAASWKVAFVSALACAIVGFLSLRATQFIMQSAFDAVRAPLHDNAFDIIILWPVVEELIFQVALQTRLTRFGAVVSVLVTTILFTLFHLADMGRFPRENELLGLVPLFFPLLMLSLLRRWNGSLVGLIVAHSTTNWLVVTLR